MARDKIDWGRAAWELAEENTRLKAENQTMREANRARKVLLAICGVESVVINKPVVHITTTVERMSTELRKRIYDAEYEILESLPDGVEMEFHILERDPLAKMKGEKENAPDRD